MIGRLLTQALARGVNVLLRSDPDGMAGLAELEGRCICVQAQGLDVAWLLTIKADGIQMSSTDATGGSADVVLTGSPPALLGLAVNRQGAQSFGKDVVIQGDIDVMQRLKLAFDNIDFDFEEPLAQVLGDIAARELMKQARSARAFGGRAGRNLSRDISEYLVEQGRFVTAATEVEEYNASVDDLRDEVARMEERIQNLKRGTLT